MAAVGGVGVVGGDAINRPVRSAERANAAGLMLFVQRVGQGAVVHEAMAAIEDGEPRLLNFGVTDEQAWEVGLACGGEVEVFVEKLD